MLVRRIILLGPPMTCIVIIHALGFIFPSLFFFFLTDEETHDRYMACFILVFHMPHMYASMSSLHARNSFHASSMLSSSYSHRFWLAHETMSFMIYIKCMFVSSCRVVAFEYPCARYLSYECPIVDDDLRYLFFTFVSLALSLRLNHKRKKDQQRPAKKKGKSKLQQTTVCIRHVHW